MIMVVLVIVVAIAIVTVVVIVTITAVMTIEGISKLNDFFTVKYYPIHLRILSNS